MAKITRGNTVECVRKMILDDIMAGAFDNNAKLITENLSSRYGISRPPIREALSQLTREGVVKSIANAGFRLNWFSGEELIDIYELRERLEGLAAAKAAKNISPETLAALRECCRTQRDAMAFDERYRADQEFHRHICDNCGSAHLRETIGKYLVLANIFGNTPEEIFDPERDVFASVDEHEAIVEAIAAGKAPLAERLMTSHIRNAKRVIRKSLNELSRRETAGAKARQGGRPKRPAK